MWQVEPSVVFGRNQVVENEVNMDYCRQHGIHMYRRKSGGGCVYADEGNLMISFITPSKHSEQVFAETLLLIRNALASKGIPAVTTAHNDILVGEKQLAEQILVGEDQASIKDGRLELPPYGVVVLK